ncbi:MAG: NAD(P)/FAD-dependent oxidoreductase [Nitrospirae bacterium]|nr:MAG: NAD(P)/FAD-dependent oxidoreductase [Nitrospirota bacterium]
MEKDVVIIGAGAAGLMCAIESEKRNRSVAVLEHAEKIGKKIRISGGGHCNFTNINVTSDKYLSHNPHFCKSALSRFAPHDFIAMLEKHGVKYHEKELGQIFCNESSAEIVNMLLNESKKSGIEIRLNCHISEIRKEDYFIISTNLGEFQSKSLVIATGGLSYPELGTTGFGHGIAKKFGIRVTPVKPALVPLTFSQKDISTFAELSGISINASVSCNNKEFLGDILFTHRGLSGPAILQISSYWNQGDAININLLPAMNVYELFLSKRESKMEIKNFLSRYLPKRFAQRWCDLYIQAKPICSYTEKELKGIAHKLHNWEIKPKETEGYKKAEVTLGGIDTGELSSKTMEAKKVAGLYFIGEVIDVTGQLGGYNLHWAWASGYAAGQYA